MGVPRTAKDRAGRKQAEHHHAAARPAQTPSSADLTLPCVVHDLNNVYQALMSAADALSEDPQWQGVSAAILRSVDRCREITAKPGDGCAASRGACRGCGERDRTRERFDDRGSRSGDEVC